MEIDIKTKYSPEAGDIISWKDDEDKILFAVIENKLDVIIGIAIRDNRENLSPYTDIPHIVRFPYHTDTNHRLTLELRARHVDAELTNFMDRWDR